MIRDTSAQDRLIVPERTSKLRRWLWPGVAAAVGLALLLWLVPSALRTLAAGTSVNATRLRIATVQRGTLVRDVSVQGRVVAAVSPTLYAPAPGTVTLDVVAGDKVQKDQVLAELYSPELTNRLAQEQAALQGLEVDYERAQIEARRKRLDVQRTLDQAAIDRKTAEREVERTTKAFKLGALPEINVLRAEDALEKADITLDNARKGVALDHDSLAFEVQAKKLARDRQQLSVAELQRQVDALKIRSPVAGQVGQLIAAQKANVALNAPLLSVVDLSALELEVQVPEVFAHDIAIGMPAEIQDASATYKGEVGAVSPEVVNGQVTARVRFGKARPAGLRQNQRLTTRILIDTHPNVLMVERGPFVDAGAGRVAYVVRGDVAERTPIQVGALSLNAVEIVSGVKEGDRIVISGTDEFNGAQRVTIH
ncbi:MAG: efflux RND transporter periplasmic adaptor subunit [Xanthomonadaceae bacterium]|nr:efflux RND transporter periplasmic adaptor subunit [Xanthomonadaceae bacterium]